MIQKLVNRYDLEDPVAARRDLEYWLSRPPAERLAAVDAFREMFYGSSVRLQRIARVVEQTRG
jgi:hypothetical protein